MTTQLMICQSLTKPAVAEIIATINLNGEVAGIEQTWEFLLGYPLEEHEGSLDPTAHAIPDNQWLEICKACMKVKNEGFLAGGTWMNVGPSSFIPDELDPKPLAEATFDDPDGQPYTTESEPLDHRSANQ